MTGWSGLDLNYVIISPNQAFTDHGEYFVQMKITMNNDSMTMTMALGIY